MTRWLAVVCAAFTASACHRGADVTGPSGSGTPETVSVLSGRTGAPIPGLTGLTAQRGQSLNLQSAGYFTLRTAFMGAPILLWPADDGFLSSGHTRRLAYAGKDPGALTRLPQGTVNVSLVPDATLRASAWAMARIAKAADTLSTSHDGLEFALDGPGFTVNLLVDLTDPVFQQQPGAACAAYVNSNGQGVITQAKVVCKSLQITGFWYSEDNFETAIVHETIHTTGLNHSSGTMDPPGIMSDTAVSYQFRAPTESERLIMKMQYQRLPGTTLAGMTESDPGLSAAAHESGWRLVCVR